MNDANNNLDISIASDVQLICEVPNADLNSM